MASVYGQRWADSYGTTPGALWQLAIDSATDAEVKRAIAAVMRSGSPHPITLPEFVELLKHGAPKGGKPGDRRDDGPAPFTPEWNAERKAVMDTIAKQSQARGVQWTERDRARSRAALSLLENPPGTAGHDEALRTYRAV